MKHERSMKPCRPPATYQAGKLRLASQIVDIMAPTGGSFTDLCCGSGAVTIEVVARGAVKPANVRMVDHSTWGAVWREVGSGTFPLETLRRLASKVPAVVSQQADFIRELLRQPASVEQTSTFLILQAGSFGGAAIVRKDDRWVGTARGAWQSKTDPRKHTGTMMPCAAEVVRRMETLCSMLLGVVGSQEDYKLLQDLSGLVYVDPPYVGFRFDNNSTAPFDFDVFARRNPRARVWVSEASALSARAVRLSSGRPMGGINGRRSSINEEWLSPIGGA